MPSRMPLLRTISLMRSVTLINCMRSLVIQSTMRLNILNPPTEWVSGANSISAILVFTEFIWTPLALRLHLAHYQWLWLASWKQLYQASPGARRINLGVMTVDVFV